MEISFNFESGFRQNNLDPNPPNFNKDLRIFSFVPASLFHNWCSAASLPVKNLIHYSHRRRIKTEEKAKVVAVGWWTYLNAALTT